MSGTTAIRRSVISADGTDIGFLSRGSGPGLVLVQGAMGTAYNFDELAQALATTFTVHTPDRRGRGMSPKPYDGAHQITRDVEDVDAVLAHTGAGMVFGLSSGAVITLEAARTLSRITRAAVYEPPFYPGGMSHDGVRQLNADIERGHLAAALISSLEVAQTAPAAIRILPRAIARMLAGAVLRVDAQRSSPYAKLREMLPGIRYDFHDVAGVDGKMDSFAGIDKPMLLAGGTRSPEFLRQSIRNLEGILPHARRVEFAGLGHSGPWNASRGGRPAVVAEALREFFAGPE